MSNPSIILLSGLNNTNKLLFIEQNTPLHQLAIIDFNHHQRVLFQEKFTEKSYFALENEVDLTDCLHQIQQNQSIQSIFILPSAQHRLLEFTEFLIEQVTPITQTSIHALISLIHLPTFFQDYQSELSLADLGLTDSFSDLTISEQLIDYIEYSDFLIAQNDHLIKKQDSLQINEMLNYLNPHACFITQSTLQKENHRSFNTFDPINTLNSAKWLQLIEQRTSNKSQTSSLQHLIYHARQPFDPEKFWQFLHEDWSNILRCKGYFWLASRPDWIGTIAQSGQICRIETAGQWWACIDRENWPQNPAVKAEIHKNWVGDLDNNVIGDRRQELVLIGYNFNPKEWAEKLNRCLISKTDANQTTFIDPFPEWQLTDHED